MKPVRFTIVALIAALGVGSAASPSAWAASTNNPRWSLCISQKEGKFEDNKCSKEGVSKSFELVFLGEGATGVLEGGTSGALVLKPSVGGATIVCKQIKQKAGANIKGSNAPNPGTSEGTAEYTECEVEGFPKCEINKEASKKGKITTTALKETLAFETKKGAEEEKGPTVGAIAPVTGTLYAEFELSGTCPITGKIKVESPKGQAGFVIQNVAPESAQETHELNAPATALLKYFVNEAGKTVEKKAELKAFGVKATGIGKGTLKVKDKEGGVQEFWGIDIN